MKLEIGIGNIDKLENSIWDYGVLSWQTQTLVDKVLLNENFNEKMSNFGHYFPTWKLQVKKKLFTIQISSIKFFNFSIFPTRTSGWSL